MATILLAAAGAGLGAGFGGTVLGLSGAVIGRAVGATLGRVLDQRILGSGSEAIEVGRVDRFRIMGASEGSAIPRLWGRVRVPGQVIWATRFQESFETSGGKGAPRPKTETYSYTVSFAVALCEGVISGVGRIWADGNEIAPSSLDMRVYTGAEDQLPDPKVEAVEGAANAPAYRGIAYIVIENLDIGAYGNRVPQFSFEVIRPAQGDAAQDYPALSKLVRGVCLIPGTGEYALATTPVHYNLGKGLNRSANVNSAAGVPDFVASLAQLRQELPLCDSVSVVVSWFGTDLRCSQCEIRPGVEQNVNDGLTGDGAAMPWRVSGVSRQAAVQVPQVGGRSVYGGTPTDQSVVQAIQAIRAEGQKVTFYPFILMEQLEGNQLPDPYSGTIGQPSLPWRGRITLDVAPGRSGSADRTASAEAEVSAFFGAASPGDFGISNGNVAYSGLQEWRFRRFILHYARLCALAGGVDTFCIGSEMRSLTQIRGAGDSFPAVAALRSLAADVRAILGPGTKISYAADWSEYFGYHTGDNVYFHLDPLWADPVIDFVAIDNYMPVSDWRDGNDHADKIWGDIHNVDYIRANIAGGEGYDWYYDGPEGEEAQLRRPITDGAYGEPWVFRYKDLRNWWQNAHHNRINGLRDNQPTAWVPQSKPIVFTEYGCAALDKGTNQPNRFIDAKSSESGLPRYSNGQRDDLIQLVYFQAMAEYWGDMANNPGSTLYSGAMVDLANSLAWAWDTRPFPDFPGNLQIWQDGINYDRGHWLNGRASNQNLAAVIAEICESSGLTGLDLSSAYGIVRGFVLNDIELARASLQPLLLAYSIDAIESEGVLAFQTRGQVSSFEIDPDRLAVSDDFQGAYEARRAADVETPRRIRLAYTESESDFRIRVAESVFPDSANDFVAQSDLPLVLTAAEALGIAERWMAEAQVSRDTIRLALPRSLSGITAGDAISVEGNVYRIDRVEQSERNAIEAIRINPAAYVANEGVTVRREWVPYAPQLPVYPLFLDLPLLTGNESPFEPYVCAAAVPWQGAVGVWSSVSDSGYVLNRTLSEPAVLGTTESELLPFAPGIWDRGPSLRVRLEFGVLSSASRLEILGGRNVAAIGNDISGNWEVFQFSQATLVAPGVYDLSLRLRGQAGSDGSNLAPWPVGSTFVLINSALQKLSLPESARGLERFYRIGSLQAGVGAQSAATSIRAFDGIGLRPYGVSHIRVEPGSGTQPSFSWKRRTRIGGDSWQSAEVPLSEESEQYTVRISANGAVIRTETVLQPTWIYSPAAQAADGATGALEFSVAQMSVVYGAGPFRSIPFTL